MNPRTPNLLGLLLCLLPVAALAQPATPTAVIDAFHASMAAGDQAKVEALLLPQVQIYEAGHVERSRAEYAAHHLPGDIAHAKKSSTKVLKREAVVTGTVAVVMSETETLDQSGKEPTTHAGTETMVLQQLNGEWRIAHVHWSSRKLKK